MDPVNAPDDPSTLENTNRVLSDLERKLSFVSTASSNQTQQSQGSSVIINKSGHQNAQGLHSSVLQYIKNDDDHFNPNDLFQERQQKFLTKFGKHYNDDSLADALATDSPTRINAHIDVIDVDDPLGISEDEDEEEEEEEDEDLYDQDSLLPPSPPRSPPREIDPDKLYGLYDFSGPDPSHCTLSREEPVFLINDLDNYWWLIRKMTKLERLMHSRKSRVYDDNIDEDEDDVSDDEDGKIGFVPAECLETYGERLARLNCFKNEELERTSRDNIIETSSQDDVLNAYDMGLIDLANPIHYQNGSQLFASQDLLLSRGNSMNKSNSLLRRTGSKKNNKSVTFESLAELDLDEDDLPQQDDTDLIREEQKKDFSPSFYDVAHDEIKKEPAAVAEERVSEVLSDIYPTETPLIVNKNAKNKTKSKSLTSSLITSPRSPTPKQPPPTPPPKDTHKSPAPKADQLQSPALKGDVFPKKPFSPSLGAELFTKPQAQSNLFDIESIGSFSPDTPPTRKLHKFQQLTPTGAEEEDDDDEGTGINNNLNHLRRSVILDRLTQMTSDIQEQLRLDHYGSSKEISGQEESDESEEEEPQEIEKRPDDSHNDTITSENVSVTIPVDETIQIKEDSDTENINLSKGLIEGDISHGSIKSENSVKSTHGDTSKGSIHSIGTSKRSIKSDIDRSIPSDMDTSHGSIHSNTDKALKDSPINNIVQDLSYDTTDSSQKGTPRDVSYDTNKDYSIIDTQQESHDEEDLIKQQEAHETSSIPKEALDSSNSYHSILEDQQEHIASTDSTDRIEPLQAHKPVESFNYDSYDKSYNYEDDAFADEEDGNDDDDHIEDFSNGEGEITPLTSMNSLNNGNFLLSTPTGYAKTRERTSAMDKRKSKPVHDMFIPILGKFDELAEKLAELDGMI